MSVSPTMLPPDQSAQGVDNTADNPLMIDPKDQLAQQGISEDDKGKFLKIVETYRTQWASDRLFRIPSWMRCNLFYRGIQVLGWDPANNVYFDALAYYRQQGSTAAGEDYDLEKYVNNITQALGEGYVGTMSQGVPGTKVSPENAEILADVTTAKAAQEAIAIIERINKIRQMVRRENLLIYLYGGYFKWTRLAIDGEWAGYDEEPVFGQITIEKPDRYHCAQCGKDTPAQPGLLDGDQGGRICETCKSPLGSADFYPAETSIEEGITGTKKVPRAMVKWTTHGPLEIDVDPQAQSLADTPILSFDQEIDVGTARKTFPVLAEKVKEGQDIAVTPNASYERLRRNETLSKGYAYTSDTFQSKITYSQVWLQPDAYYRVEDNDIDKMGETFAKRMSRLYPEGVKLGILGTEVVGIRPARLTKEWTACLRLENCGMYPPSIAENVVPFNERFNEITDLIDDWLQRCATGMTLYDRAKIDERQMKGQSFTPGTLNGIWTKGSGVDKPLTDALFQFRFQIDQNAFTWPGMILQYCYLISGLQPQTFGGGTQEKVETLGGQRDQLKMANARLRTGYENLKEEHALASQNAIECLQEAKKLGLVTELFDVIQANGSEFRNKYVDLDKFNGHIRCYPDPDEGLPQSPEDLRAMFEKLLEEAGKQNPIAQAMLDIQVNQDVILSSMAPDLVKPGEAQRSRTLQHINILLEQDWTVGVPDPQTGQPTRNLPVMPEKNVENFVVAKETIKLYRQENWDAARQNPQGWARLDAYVEMLKTLEAQDASEDAGRKAKVAQAGAPPPDPQIAQAKQSLLQDAATVAQAATSIAAGPILPKGAGSTNVAAAKTILDLTSKSVQ